MHKEIESRLGEFQDDYLEKDFLTAKVIKGIRVLPDKVQIDLTMGYPCQSAHAAKIDQIKAWLQPVTGGRDVNINLTTQIDAHTGNPAITGFPQIKNIIAIASGKGGVGKSTVAVNTALALAQEGAQVGLLDADIYGPSQPMMLGTQGVRPVINNRRISPVVKFGIQTMSIGYLVSEMAALAWRGPMLGKALEQLSNDTQWENLDYLIIDLPPGTGDVQLTMCQKIPVSGAVIVTTPQDLALSDVRRACEMFKKLNVPILGVVENMSVFHCSECGHEEKIFGEGGGEKLAHDYELPMLAAIPLDIHIREMTDNGVPPVVNKPDSPYAQSFYRLARKIAAKLALQKKDYSSKFSNIKIVQENRG